MYFSLQALELGTQNPSMLHHFSTHYNFHYLELYNDNATWWEEVNLLFLYVTKMPQVSNGKGSKFHVNRAQTDHVCLWKHSYLPYDISSKDCYYVFTSIM